jgi:hypothetical protein
MPARIPPNNAHLLFDPATYDSKKFKGFKGHDRVTTYNFIIDTCRCWDESKRVGMHRMQGQMMDDGIKNITGFSCAFLEKFITNAEQLGDKLPIWWNAEKRADCLKVAREMYHWDDIKTDVPKEVNERDSYGGPQLRTQMRNVAMIIDGVSWQEAHAKGWSTIVMVPAW